MWRGTLHILHIPSTRMNYRDYKNFHIDGFFHVYNRGHNKDLIFRDDDDYRFFLSRARQLLGLQKTKGSRWICPLPPDTFSILCYCLMPNHFHLLINQKTNVSVSSFIGRLCTSYSIYFNKKYNRVGSIFQDQFKAKSVDSDVYLSHLSAYIHKNPDAPYKWPFSSLPDYMGDRNDPIVEKDLILNIVGNNLSDYRGFLNDYNHKKELQISHLLFED